MILCVLKIITNVVIMRKLLIAANWKMHGTRSFVTEFLSGLATAAPIERDIVIFPPCIFLEQAQRLVQHSTIQLGAQNLSAHPSGAYTGEISATMLQESGCTYVLIGHSERRQQHRETDAVCMQKILAAQSHGLTPILCVGETLAMREAGHTSQVIEQQLEGIGCEPAINLENIVLAYEPIWAIGTGKTATAEQAQAVHASVRSYLRERSGDTVAKKMRLLYGGSVHAGCAAELLSQPDIDGVLVGGASLVLESFLEISGAALRATG